MPPAANGSAGGQRCWPNHKPDSSDVVFCDFFARLLNSSRKLKRLKQPLWVGDGSNATPGPEVLSELIAEEAPPSLVPAADASTSLHSEPSARDSAEHSSPVSGEAPLPCAD